MATGKDRSAIRSQLPTDTRRVVSKIPLVPRSRSRATHHAANHPARLSGGEQPRVAVVRALANNPRLLLADEPTVALDSTRGRQAMELLDSVARSTGTLVAVVTHDTRSADLFDRTLEMEDGRIISERRRSNV